MPTIINRTSVSDDKLARIVRFLGRRLPAVTETAIVFETTDPKAPGAAWMTGEAHPGGGWFAGHRQRHSSVIYIPTLERPYPVTIQNPAADGRCPWETLTDWEEELLLVLAHELTHVAQYEMAGANLLDVVHDVDDEYELEAAQVASKMLSEWRTRESGQHKKIRKADNVYETVA
jgi:hypothetical protein